MREKRNRGRYYERKNKRNPVDSDRGAGVFGYERVRSSGGRSSVDAKGVFSQFRRAFGDGLFAFERPYQTDTEKGSASGIFFRSLFGTVGIVCNFYAIDHLVWADANMLNKLSPFFAALLSALILSDMF